jgi:hypothetical protein
MDHVPMFALTLFVYVSLMTVASNIAPSSQATPALNFRVESCERAIEEGTLERVTSHYE